VDRWLNPISPLHASRFGKTPFHRNVAKSKLMVIGRKFVANVPLEKRVAWLELQVAKLQSELTSASPKKGKDWRRTIGMFTDNPGMKAIFDEAGKLREADRRKARQPAPKRRKPAQ